MRIALFSDVYKPTINGVVNHVSLLKEQLEAKGEQVWLFVPGSQESVSDEPNIVRIPGIPIADTGYHLSVSLDQRSRELLQHVDVIHVHHPFVSGSIGLFSATRYNIPLVFTNHTRYDLYVKQYLPLLPTALSDSALTAFFQMFSQRCAALIAPSPGIAGVMQEWGVQAKVHVIPNGIDLERFRAPAWTTTREAVGLPADAMVAVFVGRMSGEKDVERLIKLFALVLEEMRGKSGGAEAHPVYLLLVGGGPELADYRALVNELGVADRVILTGKVPYEHVPGYIALADFFVSASVSEVHPLTFIEAAAVGLPALGLASPGVSDLIRDGETGFVAQDNDFSFGLRFLRLAQDPDLRQRMGQAAQQDSTRYSARANARSILDLYQKVAG